MLVCVVALFSKKNIYCRTHPKFGSYWKHEVVINDFQLSLKFFNIIFFSFFNDCRQEIGTRLEMQPKPVGMPATSLPSILRIQIHEGFKRRDLKVLRSTFDSHKTGCVISASSLRDALKKLGIHVVEAEVDTLLKSSDADDDGLDFDEFSKLVSRSSPVLDFLRSLPLAELVFDGLPKEDGCAGEDQLRKLVSISPKELEVSVQAITEGLLTMLNKSFAALKEAYDLLDSKAAANDTASAKFEMTPMSVGTIKNFHDGIAVRIGDAQMS
jgi:Ca2+-binding EF-hand superfamily protein